MRGHVYISCINAEHTPIFRNALTIFLMHIGTYTGRLRPALYLIFLGVVALSVLLIAPPLLTELSVSTDCTTTTMESSTAPSPRDVEQPALQAQASTDLQPKPDSVINSEPTLNPLQNLPLHPNVNDPEEIELFSDALIAPPGPLPPFRQVPRRSSSSPVSNASQSPLPSFRQVQKGESPRSRSSSSSNQGQRQREGEERKDERTVNSTFSIVSIFTRKRIPSLHSSYFRVSADLSHTSFPGVAATRTITLTYHDTTQHTNLPIPSLSHHVFPLIIPTLTPFSAGHRPGKDRDGGQH